MTIQDSYNCVCMCFKKKEPLRDNAGSLTTSLYLVIMRRSLIVVLITFLVGPFQCVSSQQIENRTTNSDFLNFYDDSAYIVSNLGPLHLWVEPTPSILEQEEVFQVLDRVQDVMDKYMEQEMTSYRFVRFIQFDDIQINFSTGKGIPSRRSLVRKDRIRHLNSGNPATVISVPGLDLVFKEEVPEDDASLQNRLATAVNAAFKLSPQTSVAMAISDSGAAFPWSVSVYWGKDPPVLSSSEEIPDEDSRGNGSMYSIVSAASVLLISIALFIGYRRRRNRMNREFIYTPNRLRTESNVTREFHGLDYLYEQGSKVGGFPNFQLQPWIDEKDDQSLHKNPKDHVGEHVVVPADKSDVSSVTTDRSAYRFPLSIQEQEMFNVIRIQQDLYGETRFGFDRIGARPPSLLKGDLSVSSASDISDGSDVGHVVASNNLMDEKDITNDDLFETQPRRFHLTTKDIGDEAKLPLYTYDDDQSSVGDMLRPMV